MKVILAIFLITAIYDLIWRLMAEKKIVICLSDETVVFCPSKWEWIKTGEKYFKSHSVIGAMFIAGVAGVYALAVMGIIRTIMPYDSFVPHLLNCLFSSWVVGIPMRYATDAVHVRLFENLREHYYKPLGFAWSSFTDTQSGVIVFLTYYFLKMITVL
tara:strand:- start:3299 stop:3772 length:474 start_codon:yes stop_codon:yes gene_type:complete